MRYRRDGQRHSQPDRTFARRVKYETFKEGGGTLLQQAGAALGALIGLFASRWGVQPTASVITGAIVGATVGAVGRGFVTAAADHLKERGDQRRARRMSRSPVAHYWSGQVGDVGRVISGIGEVIQQIESAYTQLGGLTDRMRATHDVVMKMLSGGRSDVLQQTHARLTTARKDIEESLGLLRRANEDLRGYLSSL